MFSSKVVATILAVFASCFLTASSLVCYKCDGMNTAPACTMNETCNAIERQCIAQVEKDDDGKVSYKRGCAFVAACTSKKALCATQKLVKKMDACSYSCCDSDLCNKAFPALDSAVQVTSGLVAVLTTVVFAFFVM